MTLWDGCGFGPTPVVAEDFGPGSGPLRGWLYGQVTLAPGGTATLDGTWSAPVPFQIALTGIPPTVGSADINVTRYAGPQAIYTHQTGSLPVTGGTLTTTLLQTSAGDGIVTEFHFQDSFGHRNDVLEYRNTAATSLVGDVTADLISQPFDVTQTMGELYPGGPQGITGAQWTMSGSGDYDGFAVDFLAVDGDFTEYHWTVVAPPGPTGAIELRLPPLPADLAPLWAARMLEGLTVLAADTGATSYAEFRRDAAPLAMPWNFMLSPTRPVKIRLGRAG
jgi:hypothetical protein